MPDEDRILTVPNVLSVVRLLCVPVFLYLLFGRDSRGPAAYLLAVLGVTDWVDGFIARRYDQVSTVGKVLDPTADRILLLVGVAAIVIDGSVPWWVAALALTREVLVGGGVLVLAAMGARRIDVQLVGKAGTFAMMVAFPLFLGSHDPHLGWEGVARILAWCFVIPGLVLAWYSAFAYIPLARGALADRQVGSEP